MKEYKNKKRIIGLTGGIGTGKTTVLNILKDRFGADIIEADKVGHMVQAPDGPAYSKLIDAFSEKILSKDTTALNGKPCIDRKILGSIVFNDSEKLKLLNSIIHPVMYDEIKKHIENSHNQIIVIEGALLLETGFCKLCNEIWYVRADQDIRLKRLIESRGISKEKALSVMKTQLDEAAFTAGSSAVIDNSLSIEHTYKQIYNLINKEDKNV